LNANFISLLPKVVGADDIEKFRPISFSFTIIKF